MENDIDKRKTAPPGVILNQPTQSTTKQAPPNRSTTIINKTSLITPTIKTKPTPPPPSQDETNDNSNEEMKKTPPKVTPRSVSNQFNPNEVSSTNNNNNVGVSVSVSASTSSNSLLSPPIRSSMSIESLVSDLDDSDVSDEEEDDTDEEEEEMHENFLKDVIGKNTNQSLSTLKEQERKELEAMAGGSKFRVTRCFVGPVVPTGSGRQLPKPPSTTNNGSTTTTNNNIRPPSVAIQSNNSNTINNINNNHHPTSNVASSNSTNNTSVSNNNNTTPPQQHQPSTHNNQQNRKTIINPVIHRPLPPKKPLPPPPSKKSPQINMVDNPKMQAAASKIQRAYRNYKFRLPYIKLKVLYRYRWNIIQEIVNTEKTYINTLNQLSIHFIDPLRKGGYISHEDVKFIFNGIDSILAINTSLLNGLMEVLLNWTPYSCLGKYFSKMIPFLKAYTDYVKNFDFVLQRISQCANKESKFQAFITGAEDRCIPKSRLESMLITPVQRIPRYVLLLQDLLKHTEENHPDFKDISESLEQMKKVAMQINDTKRQSDNSLKVVEVQNKLVGKFSNIVTAERRYNYEGYLFVGDTNAKSKKIYLFLFNDILIFAKPVSAKLFNTKSKFKFLKCEDLFPSPLLTDIPNNPIMQHCFEIVVQSVEMRFFAENQESKSIWLAQLQKVFSEIEKNQAKDEQHINIKKAEEKAKEFKAYVGYQYAALKYKGSTRGATLSASSLNGMTSGQPDQSSPNTSSTNLQNLNNNSGAPNGNMENSNNSNSNGDNNMSNNSNFMCVNNSNNNSSNGSNGNNIDLNSSSSNGNNGSTLNLSQSSQAPPSLYRQATFHKMSYQTRMETIKDAEEKTQQILLEEQNKQQQQAQAQQQQQEARDKQTVESTREKLSTMSFNKPGSQTFGRNTISSSTGAPDDKKSKSSPSLNKIFQITGMSNSEKDKVEKEKDKKKAALPPNAKLAPQISSTNLKALNNELSSSKQFNSKGLE